MRFFYDTARAEERIQDTIRRFGYAPEHNFYWYQYCREPKEKNVFVQFSDGSGLLTAENESKRAAFLFSQPLAPPEKRALLLLRYIDAILRDGRFGRVEVELDTKSRKTLKTALPPHLRARALIATLTSPVMDLRAFDPLLSGRHCKSLRHARNKFYREHRIEVVDARMCKKETLVKIITDWGHTRRTHDRVGYGQYRNLIEKNFMGVPSARALIADGTPRGLNAGWPIPNTNRFYAAIGIHDYSIPDLGQMLYLDDLLWIKARGYAEADMGGSGKELLSFKNQFHPAYLYKTHYFSVVQNESAVSPYFVSAPMKVLR